MFKFRFSLAAAVLAGCSLGCELEPQQYRFGENISGLQYEFFDEDEGVHPSQVVLLNERNPFRESGVGFDTKFSILGSGINAGAFYAWATLLANEPNGEHQFYTAVKARDIYDANEVQGEDQEKIRMIAVRGFQTVLDDFPDAVTFDVTGKIAFRLATPSFLALLELNEIPQGDWILVQDPQGNPVAVKGAGVDVVRVPPPEEDDS